MAGRIQGITVEIGGDTTKLEKALRGVNATIRSTQSQLKDINKLLKLDPSNTELLSQKHRVLKDAIGATKEKLDALKTAQEQAKQQLESGTLGQAQQLEPHADKWPGNECANCGKFFVVSGSIYGYPIGACESEYIDVNNAEVKGGLQMLVSGINWSCNWVQVITITGTYTCPMEERDDDFYFRFKNQWHPVTLSGNAGL